MLVALLLTALFHIPNSWAYTVSETQIPVITAQYEVDTPKAILAYYATLYGLPDWKLQQIYATVQCESGFNEFAANPHDSDGGSWGLVQINIGKDAHPDITKEQALNKYFASWFIVSEFAKGNKWKWTCARILGYL
jgi:hypothetical protein